MVIACGFRPDVPSGALGFLRLRGAFQWYGMEIRLGNMVAPVFLRPFKQTGRRKTPAPEADPITVIFPSVSEIA